jgi:uncharacterized membrane protein (UPF0182 family)
VTVAFGVVVGMGAVLIAAVLAVQVVARQWVTHHDPAAVSDPRRSLVRPALRGIGWVLLLVVAVLWGLWAYEGHLVRSGQPVPWWIGR